MVIITKISEDKLDASYCGNYTAIVDKIESIDLKSIGIRIKLTGRNEIKYTYCVTGNNVKKIIPKILYMSKYDFAKGVMFNSVKLILERFVKFLNYYFTIPEVEAFMVQEKTEFYRRIPPNERKTQAAFLLTQCDEEEGEITLSIIYTIYGFMVTMDSAPDPVLKIRTELHNIPSGEMKINVDRSSSIAREIFLRLV